MKFELEISAQRIAVEIGKADKLLAFLAEHGIQWIAGSAQPQEEHRRQQRAKKIARARPAQDAVLAYVHAHPGCTVDDITGGAEGVRPVTVSPALSRLFQDGRIKRTGSRSMSDPYRYFPAGTRKSAAGDDLLSSVSAVAITVDKAA